MSKVGKTRNTFCCYDEDQCSLITLALILQERAQRTTCTQAFSTTAAKKALVLSLGTMLFQQLSGINAVIFNVENIFRVSESAVHQHHFPKALNTNF